MLQHFLQSCNMLSGPFGFSGQGTHTSVSAYHTPSIRSILKISTDLDTCDNNYEDRSIIM